MSPATEIFDLPITIVPADIDSMQHVNNVTYVRWVQDVAVAHWNSATTPAERAKWLWMVIRHEIDYKQQAKMGDELMARTWVGYARGLKFQRHTEIFRVSDGTLLAKALSVWCPIDADTKRPAIVSDDIRRRFSIPD